MEKIRRGAGKKGAGVCAVRRGEERSGRRQGEGASFENSKQRSWGWFGIVSHGQPSDRCRPDPNLCWRHRHSMVLRANAATLSFRDKPDVSSRERHNRAERRYEEHAGGFGHSLTCNHVP